MLNKIMYLNVEYIQLFFKFSYIVTIILFYYIFILHSMYINELTLKYAFLTLKECIYTHFKPFQGFKKKKKISPLFD